MQSAVSGDNGFAIRGKQMIAHTSIIVGFVLLAVFVADPLFARLEGIPGEAQLQHIALPAEVDSIQYAIDFVRTDGRIVAEIGGWGFIEGHDSELGASSICLVLRSDTHTYVFDTFPRRRPDVTAHFEELGLHLDWAGFTVSIPLRKIVRGDYALGLYIRVGDVEALRYTGVTAKL